MSEPKAKKGKKPPAADRSPLNTEPDSRATPMALHPLDFIEANKHNWLTAAYVANGIIDHLLDETVLMSRDKRLNRV